MGIAITAVATIHTTTFKDAFGLKAEVWEASFYLLTGIGVLWLIKTVVDRRHRVSVDDVIAELRGQPIKRSGWIERVRSLLNRS